MTEQILHVGLHKTGSTFLQQQVFPKLRGVLYNGSGYWCDDFAKSLDRQLRFWNPLYVDGDAWRKEIERIQAERNAGILLLSQESLVGRLLDGYRDHEYLTAKLKVICPDAKIFLVFRRQDTWVESAYRQTLHLGFSVPADRFLNATTKAPFGHMSRPNYVQLSLNTNQLDWSLVVENYQKTFGRDRVLALPYELMSEDIQGFLKRFYEFSGIDPYYPAKASRANRSYSLPSARLAYFVNKFVPRRQRRLVREFLQEKVDRLYYRPGNLLSDDVRAAIWTYYADANRRLEQVSGCALAQYGYY